jgi:hypothetical protein
MTCWKFLFEEGHKGFGPGPKFIDRRERPCE